MDGLKWENMTKVRYTNAIISFSTYEPSLVFLFQICVHVTRNALVSGSESDCGILFLECIRAYVELDLLASFEVHTDHTIAWGRAVLECFANLAMVRYITLPPPHGNRH